MRMLSALLLLIAGLSTATGTASAQTPAAEAWEIGPIIRGRNRSIGMPLNPEPAGRGIAFDFPYPTAGAGHVHYVTFRHGPLINKRRVVMRYRIDAARGVRFVPQESPGATATLSLFFQRGGDTWNGRGPYAHYRWWSGVQVPVTPGVHQLAVDLDDEWISVWAGSNRQTPGAFRAALAGADRVGFVLGANGARGHGVFATGPARLTVLSFQII